MNEQAVFLLDTCAIVQIAGPKPLQADTAQAVEQAANSGLGFASRQFLLGKSAWLLLTAEEDTA